MMKKAIPLFLVLLMICSLFSAVAGETITSEDLSVVPEVAFKDPKMESTVAYIVSVSETDPAKLQDVAESRDLDIIGDKIRVVLELADEKVALKDINLKVEAKYENLAQVLVPISEIAAITKDPAVLYIRMPLKAYPSVTT